MIFEQLLANCEHCKIFFFAGLPIPCLHYGSFFCCQNLYVTHHAVAMQTIFATCNVFDMQQTVHNINAFLFRPNLFENGHAMMCACYTSKHSSEINVCIDVGLLRYILVRTCSIHIQSGFPSTMFTELKPPYQLAVLSLRENVKKRGSNKKFFSPGML